MSGEQFLRKHGWRLGQGLWWNDRLPDAGHDYGVALLQQAQWLAAELAELRERIGAEATDPARRRAHAF